MNHQLRIYNNMLELSANTDNPTPLVKLNKLNPFSKITMYAKLEWYNPFGAVKDRPALAMIEAAEKKGLLQGKKMIEPTSGNTGIGLAGLANLKGYKLRTTVSSQIPEEKKIILKTLGAEVVEVADTLCPDPNSPTGAIGIAMNTAKLMPDKYYMLNQYENLANIEAHYTTTGPEIWKQTEGKVTHVFAGLGTCGTIGGIGKFLKEKNSTIKVIAVHPQENHNIPGVRSLKQLQVTKLYQPELYDAIVEVHDQEAYAMCLRLNREESIIAGPSSGMVVAGALKFLKESDGGVAVFIFPDNIFKYTTFLSKLYQAPQAAQANPVAEQYFNQLTQLARNEHTTIEPEEARQWMEKEKPLIIDVRPPDVYAKGHLPGAQNIPLDQLPTVSLPENRETSIMTVCHRGNASLIGLLLLQARGYTKVKSMNKGTLGWMEKGYDVEK